MKCPDITVSLLVLFNYFDRMTRITKLKFKDKAVVLSGTIFLTCFCQCALNKVVNPTYGLW